MKIQAICSGYEGRPACVYAGYDAEKDVLVISRVADIRLTRFQDFRVVTNCKAEAWDSWFDETHFPDAIEAFNARLGMDRIIFKQDAARANPKTALQLLKVTESGRKYEVSAAISAAQVCTLMIAWHLKAATAIADAFAFGDLLTSMDRGELWTA